MFNVKRVMSMILCFVLMLSVSLTAKAAEVEISNKDLEEYITFTSGPERIDADGAFTVNVRGSLTSGKFTANKTEIKISTTCRRYNVNKDEYKSTSNKYTVTLYKVGSTKEIGHYNGLADGKEASGNFSVEKGAKYYFVFTCNPTQMLMYGKEASNRKQEIDRQHYTIPNQRPKDKHCGKI